MSTTLNFDVKYALHFLTKQDRWNVLSVLIVHANTRNRCWPSLTKIAHSATSGNRNHASDAKQWLLRHNAFRIIPYQKRFGEDEINLPRRQHIYELTGYIDTCDDPNCDCGADSKRYMYLYVNIPREANEPKEEPKEDKKGKVKEQVELVSESIDGDTFGPESMTIDTIDGDTISNSNRSNSKRAVKTPLASLAVSLTALPQSENSLKENPSEKRVTEALTRLKLAKIRFARTQFLKRRELIEAAIDEYGFYDLKMAIQQSKEEGARWWSYVTNKLKAQKPVQPTGEDYITGPYADYIDH